MENKLNFALIYGGQGMERQISVMGAVNLYQSIDRKIFDVKNNISNIFCNTWNA